MHPVSQPDWLPEPTDSWGSHSSVEPTQGLAGSRQIRRHNSCWLWGKSLPHTTNYNLLLHFSVPASKKSAYEQKSAAPCAHSFAALFLSRLDEKAQVSASSDPCCDHWAQSWKLKSRQSFYWHKADTNLKEFKDLCKDFAITFISCSHWETNLCISVRGTQVMFQQLQHRSLLQTRTRAGNCAVTF